MILVSEAVKKSGLIFAASFLIASHALMGQSNSATSGSWSGVIVNGDCTLDEAFTEAARCTEDRGPGAKLVLYDDTIRKLYTLDPQDQAVGHLGDGVTVAGDLQGNTIKVASFKLLTAIGLNVGQKAPAFTARDQFGREQTLATLRGPKGTVILFFRSADWWPYCKGQLVQLQNAKARFEKQGLKVAGISYDSEDILKFFAGRQKIDFPLLADPESTTIRAYQVLNAEAVGQFLGMARPGFFFIDTKGIIREKFFEAKYRDRLTGNNLIAKLFPELGDEVSDTVDAPHLQVAVEQSDRTGVPGGRITLTAEVRLPAGIHVYAPGTKGYKTVELSIESQLGLETTPSVYPRAKVLYMSAIKERVPVFEGTFRIRQDLKVSSAGAFSNSLGTAGKRFTIAGKLAYQACDSKQCFFPMSVPLHWQVQIVPLDRQRAPENIQHK
jgi:peroxiredoxin